MFIRATTGRNVDRKGSVSKFAVLKKMDSIFSPKPRGRLDGSECMLKDLVCSDIVLENEFKMQWHQRLSKITLPGQRYHP